MAFLRACCSCFGSSTHTERNPTEHNQAANYQPTLSPTPAITEPPLTPPIRYPSSTSPLSSASPLSPPLSNASYPSINSSWHYPINLAEFQKLNGDLTGDALAIQLCFTLLNANLSDDDRTNFSAQLNQHSLIQQKTRVLIASAQINNLEFISAANSNDQAQLTHLYQQYRGQINNPDHSTQALMMMVALIANPHSPIELAGNAFGSAMGIEMTEDEAIDIDQAIADVPISVRNPNPNSPTDVAKSFAFTLIYLRFSSLSGNSSGNF